MDTTTNITFAEKLQELLQESYELAYKYRFDPAVYAVHNAYMEALTNLSKLI